MPRGTSLIEAGIAIAVMALLVVVVLGFANGVGLNRTSALQAVAAELAQAELEALRGVPYAALTDQTNGPPLGRIDRFGTWAVVADGSVGHSGPNVLATSPVTGATGRTGTLPVPALPVSDGTIEAHILPTTGTPNGWSAGFYFRARDVRNGYRVAFTATQLTVLRLDNGTPTTLHTGAGTFTPGTWQTLRVEATGSTLVVKVGGATVATLSDATYPSGNTALYAGDGALVHFDDITTPDATRAFDTDTVGALPPSWVRLSANDLPDATPAIPDDNVQVTIEDQVANDDAIRKLTVTVSWFERGATRSLTLSTLRAQFGAYL